MLLDCINILIVLSINSINYYYNDTGLINAGNTDFKKVSIFAENYILAEGFAVSSDRRIKENIRDVEIESFLEKIKKLQDKPDFLHQFVSNSNPLFSAILYSAPPTFYYVSIPV